MWFQDKKIQYPSHFCSIAIIFLLVLATFRVAMTDGGHRSLIPAAWYLKSMCGAISSLNYGREGYVCYKSVFEALKDLNEIELNHNSKVNGIFQQALSLKDPAREGIYTMGETDAGYIDYCRFAFLLFGYHIESLFYMYFLLFLIPVLIFFVTFRKSKIAVFTLIIFLLAHYLLVKAAPYVGNLSYVHSYRFMPILAILPLIHILMLTLLDWPLKIFTFIGALTQAFVLAFILWIRSSILWMAALLLAYITFELFKRGDKQGQLIKSIKTKFWPGLIVLCVVLISKASIPFFLDPEYKKDNGTSYHLVWHSIYVGLALHPDIRENYSNAVYGDAVYGISRGKRVHGPVCSDENMQGNPIKVAVKEWLCADAHRWVFEVIYAVKHPIEYQPNDQDGYSAAFKWLREHGMSEYYLFNFQPKDHVDYKKDFAWFNYNSAMNTRRPFNWNEDFKWSRYDSVLQDVIKDAAQNHPLQIAQNFFIDKPIRYLCACFHYASLNYLPLWFLPIVFFHFYMTEVERLRREIFQVLKWLALIFMFSLIPVFWAYPAEYLVADSVLILTMTIFIILFVFINTKLRSWAMLPDAPRRPK